MTEAATFINQQTNNFRPSVGIILGSGLGSFADGVEDPQIIDYQHLKDFPEAGVPGHEGRLILGNRGQHRVAVCQGRSHYYEHGNPAVMKPVIHTLKAIGCELIVLTNAAGSLLPEAPAGSVMLITDHISMTGVSPLFGETGNDRFVDLSDAYDPKINSILKKLAVEKNISLHEGVYMWFCGPHFETVAEIRMAKVMGASSVGMSTVPEVILARQLGMKVAAMSNITNLAAGMSEWKLTHEQTIENAKEGAQKVQILINALLEQETL